MPKGHRKYGIFFIATFKLYLKNSSFLKKKRKVLCLTYLDLFYTGINWIFPERNYIFYEIASHSKSIKPKPILLPALETRVFLNKITAF